MRHKGCIYFRCSLGKWKCSVRYIIVHLLLSSEAVSRVGTACCVWSVVRLVWRFPQVVYVVRIALFVIADKYRLLYLDKILCIQIMITIAQIPWY